MSNTVISVENLSKSYRLGQIGTGTLTNDLKVWWAKKRGLPNPLLKIGQADHGNRDGEELWALRDVSFTVQQGEVLGIIGRNGAGKSTLLKILSRVTAPTGGCVKVRGRIASLLEVGTGFHPELTGRENIYLNGAILGMSREEVRRKFDEIVAFAEVEKFIDTPVKRYSSGMYVRLAFAVAAHLESEILLVDEVLAVGDAEFQKKCLGKMGDVASKEGRTVLFVSHNMGAIEILCTKAIEIEQGFVNGIGLTREIINHYLHSRRGIVNSKVIFNNKDDKSNMIGEIKSICLLNDKKALISDIEMGDNLHLKIEFKVYRQIRTPTFSVRISNQMGQNLIYWHSGEMFGLLPSSYNGGSIYLHTTSINLLSGIYNLSLGFSDGYQTIDQIENALSFEINPKAIYKTGKTPDSQRAIIFTQCKWEIDYS